MLPRHPHAIIGARDEIAATYLDCAHARQLEPPHAVQLAGTMPRRGDATLSYAEVPRTAESDVTETSALASKTKLRCVTATGDDDARL